MILAVRGLPTGRGLSLVAASGGHSRVAACGFSLRWPLLFGSTGSRVLRPQRLRLWDSRTQSQQLWSTGPVALWHVGSSWVRG